MQSVSIISTNHSQPQDSEIVASCDKATAANDHNISASDTAPSQIGPQNAHAGIDLSTQYAGYLHNLFAIKAKGSDWQRTYDIPGKKKLREIVGEAYAVFISIEACAFPLEMYRRLALRLKADKIKMHADAPNSAIVVRTVFPKLDPSRVHKYARALDVAASKFVLPQGFAQFVQDAGGFDKLRLNPAPSLTPQKALAPAKTTPRKSFGPHIEADGEDDISDSELELLEYCDELDALLRARQQAEPLLTATLTQKQLEQFNSYCPHRIVLIAELHEGVLKIFDQVPYIEDAIASAYRSSYPTCDDVREAVNLQITSPNL